MSPVVDLLTGLATTRAIRRLRPDPIPDDDLNTILWHATRAPSGTNRQPVRYVVLRDDAAGRAAKAVLARGFRAGWSAKAADANYDSGSAIDASSPKGRQRAAMQYLVDHFEQTSVVVLVCLERYRDPNPYEGASVYPACQNLLLAARALGYGGVMTGWHHRVDAELRDLLGIPSTVGIHATIPLGRPIGNHGPVRRLPLGDVVFDGGWGRSAGWATDPEGTRFAGPPPSPRPLVATNPTGLPDGLVLDRTTPEFTAATVPAGLRRAHRVAAGVWGRLVVRRGALRFVFDDDVEHPIEVAAGDTVVIPPDRAHHIEFGPDEHGLGDDTAFVVEFHTRPD